MKLPQRELLGLSRLHWSLIALMLLAIVGLFMFDAYKRYGDSRDPGVERGIIFLSTDGRQL